MFSPDELREIAARASTIDECLAGRYQALHTAESAAKADRCVTRWRRIAADGNSKLFERRLSRGSLDITPLTPLLGHVRLDPQAEPPWLKTF